MTFKSAEANFYALNFRMLNHLRIFPYAFLLAFVSVAWASDTPGQAVRVNFYVLDENQRSVADTLIEVRLQEQTVARTTTDESGKGSITVHAPGRYVLRVTKKGYLAVESSVAIQGASASETVDISLSRIDLSKQDITVHQTSSDPVTEESSSPSTLTPKQAEQTPSRPATLKDTLPLLPGVVRARDGRTGIAGYSENHSALLVNSVDVTDPATGAFGLSIPIDSVETIKVAEMPYLAQYGKFIAGVVTAETRPGGDKWSISLNDPLPEFRIRSGHLEGVKDMSPRLNFGGPLIANRLFVSEGAEYLLHKQPVRGLTFPANETWFKAINSFTQVDAILSSTQTLTGSFHDSPHSLRYADLDFFNPQSVTANADFKESTETIIHRIAIGGGVLQSTLANTRVVSRIQPQGTAEMLLSPLRNGGNYFSQQLRRATRFAWVENWMPRARQFHGSHLLQLGSVLSYSEDEGQLRARPVKVQDAGGRTLQRIDFIGGKAFALSDYAPAVYAQDHWILTPQLALDVGVRFEEQTITFTSRTAPRGGFVWTPSQNKRTVFRGGAGIFYDSVALGIYAFNSFPEQLVTSFNAAGGIVGEPIHYVNTTQETTRSGFAFVDRAKRSGNFSPSSFAWNLEMQREISNFLLVRVKYLQSAAQDLITLQPRVLHGQSALVLESSGTARSRQYEFTSRIGSTPQRQFFFSYVRQYARGNLNDASGYTGNFPFPVVHHDLTASLPNEIPNRFLLWGTFSFPRKFQLNPQVEWRSGFAYQPVNVLQQYILSAGSGRFPRYFSFDLLVSKDFQITKKHAIRISIPMTNLTNHFNPLEVHSNIADPQYGKYFASYPRRVLLDFDFLN
ncbi:MAG: TonB-dependent receptor [Acidobacteriota bacterium]|nr:TonB-dependent receptor [Acidobacteriota bacterium]